jgi:hypothetical protein
MGRCTSVQQSNTVGCPAATSKQKRTDRCFSQNLFFFIFFGGLEENPIPKKERKKKHIDNQL